MISLPARRRPLNSLRQVLTLGALVAAPMILPMAAKALDFPRTGVVCDQSRQICFDVKGASVEQTRTRFGNWAARNVQCQLTNQCPRNEIMFSSGELCDLQRRTCWQNGTSRSNINTSLSRQLFGTNGGWSDGNQTNNNNQTENRRASCQLSQQGRLLYNGACDLRRRNAENGIAYVFELPDGRQYRFINRQGKLVQRSGNLTWAAQSWIEGEDVRFRWSDMQLVTRPPEPIAGLYPYPNNQYPNNQYPNSNSPAPTGSFLEGLFNSLFR